MKKTIALFLALMCLAGAAGCGGSPGTEGGEATGVKTVPLVEADTPDGNDTDAIVLIKSAEESTEPYLCETWAEIWSEQGWLCVDRARASDDLSAIVGKLPGVDYSDDLEIVYGSGTEAVHLDIYDDDHEPVLPELLGEESVNIPTLPEGTYYVILSVRMRGEYIEPEEQFEMFGYECLFRLEV